MEQGERGSSNGHQTKDKSSKTDLKVVYLDKSIGVAGSVTLPVSHDTSRKEETKTNQSSEVSFGHVICRCCDCISRLPVWPISFAKLVIIAINKRKSRCQRTGLGKVLGRYHRQVEENGQTVRMASSSSSGLNVSRQGKR